MKHSNKITMKRGFTLIELLLVIVIISLLGFLSTPFYSRFIIQNSVATTTDQLIGSFRKAQQYSMMGKENSTWGLNYAAHTITLFQGNSFATRNIALDEIFIINQNITITGFTEITFSRVNGIPSTIATITISGGNTTDIITINGQGVVSRS